MSLARTRFGFACLAAALTGAGAAAAAPLDSPGFTFASAGAGSGSGSTPIQRGRGSSPDPKVLSLALGAVGCAQSRGLPQAERVGIIDYSLPSSATRLWVMDLASGSTLFQERVAHGRGSGGERAVRFSNRIDSNKSSLGLFRTLDAYEGGNGYSLNLQGLEPGVNDHALTRRIVIHGADYVSDDFVTLIGRLGRSFGCPAVRREVARPLIDSLKHDQYVFAYYPDPKWIGTSTYVSCASAPVQVEASAEPLPQAHLVKTERTPGVPSVKFTVSP